MSPTGSLLAYWLTSCRLLGLALPIGAGTAYWGWHCLLTPSRLLPLSLWSPTTAGTAGTAGTGTAGAGTGTGATGTAGAGTGAGGAGTGTTGTGAGTAGTGAGCWCRLLLVLPLVLVVLPTGAAYS